MKEETKRMIRDSLVSAFQLSLGRAVDSQCDMNCYPDEHKPYLAVGIVDDGRCMRLVAEGADTEDDPWHNSYVYYLGALDMSQYAKSDYECECGAFQEKIEKYIDDKLNEPDE